MSEDKARRLTAALVEGVTTLALEADVALERFPWLDNPDEVSCIDLISAILSLSEESAGRDLLDTEPTEMLGGIATAPTYRRPPGEPAHPPAVPRDDRMSSKPVQSGLNQAIDAMGAVMANLAVAGIPLDDPLKHLEYWLHEIRRLSSP